MRVLTLEVEATGEQMKRTVFCLSAELKKEKDGGSDDVIRLVLIGPFLLRDAPGLMGKSGDGSWTSVFLMSVNTCWDSCRHPAALRTH